MDWDKEEERVRTLEYTLPKKLTDILDGFKKAVHTKFTSVVPIADGRSGLGKTTIMNQVGNYCDPNFNLNKLHYNPDTFLNGGDGKIGLAQAQPGDFLVFDEAMLVSSRAALSIVNRMIVQAMSMIRSKRLFVGFNVNSIFDLDKNLVLSRADICLHVYGNSLTNRGQFCAFFKGLDGEDRLKMLYLLGKRFYNYSKPKANFYARFPKNFVLDEVEYEKQKQKGVNEFLSQTNISHAGAKAMAQRNNYIVWLVENTKLEQKEIARIGEMGYELVRKVLAAKRKEERDNNEKP